MGEPARADDVADLSIPGFELIERLGAGGFGAVYLARHVVIGREVAIKVLHAGYASDAEAVARFIAEARAVGNLSHPAIVELHEIGTLADDRPYMVMERIRGRTLRDVLRERGGVPLGAAVPILRGIAEALDAVHAAGIAHRDLKPDNVFVVDGGGVKLIDFGLAKLAREDGVPVTQTGAVFGTPLYMSPEQCRGKASTPATDAYSFGALAYHVLTGEPPFSGEALELALHHLHDPPPRPSSRAALPRAVDEVVGALMAKDPAARPMPLGRAVDAMTGAGLRRRRRRWLAVAALGVPALVVAGTIAIMRGGAEDEARAPALAFTMRPLRIRISQTTYPDVRMAPDARSVAYTTEAGRWRRDLFTGASSRISTEPHTLQPLSGGRMLRAPANVAGDPIQPAIVDAAGRTIRTLPLIGRAAMSPDETAIAGLWDEWIVVHDLGSGRTRRLVSVAEHAPVEGPLMWSPDGKTVLWFSQSGPRDRRGHATRIADGATRSILLPVLADIDLEAAASFLDDGRIIYCAEDTRGSSIRVRELDDAAGVSERVVAPLDPSVSSCGFTRAPGDHFVLSVIHARTQAATLELRETHRELRFAGGDGSARAVAALSRDGSRIYAYSRGRGHIARGIYDYVPPGPLELREIGVLGGLERAVPTCRDEVAVVVVGDELLHVAVARDATVVELALLDGRCTPRHRWRLPPGSWSAPQCSRTMCVIGHRDRDDFVVWKLAFSTQAAGELARYRLDTWNDFGPSFGIAPDERAVVALAGRRGAPHVITLEGSVRALPRGMAMPQSVGWTRDPEVVVVAGMGVEGNPLGVVAVRLDGTTEVLWSSATTWFGKIVTSAASDVIAGNARDIRIELVQLDRAGAR